MSRFLPGAVALSAAWIACGGDPSLERAQTSGLRVGYAVEPPFAWLDGGRVTGESPETARVIAAQLGIARVDLRLGDFGSLIDELLERRIDVIAAGMFVTPERARRVAFSRPTVRVRQALLVRKGNPRGLHGYAGLPDDVRVAALAGSVEAALLERLGLTPPRLVIVPDARAGTVAVAAGEADGLALSRATLTWLARQADLGATELAEPFVAPPEAADLGRVAFAFHPDDVALREAWDAALARFVGSPAHLALVAPYGFGPDDVAPPGTPP